MEFEILFNLHICCPQVECFDCLYVHPVPFKKVKCTKYVCLHPFRFNTDTRGLLWPQRGSFYLKTSKTERDLPLCFQQVKVDIFSAIKE